MDGAVSAGGRPPGDERVLLPHGRPARRPRIEYLNISNRPAWALLERLAQFPAGWPREVFRRACRDESRHGSAGGSRRKHLGPSLSISYDQPLHIIRGWRQHLYDSGGRAYLDCVNNVAHVGHCHPRVNEAVGEADRRCSIPTRAICTNYLAEYVERLTATLPAPLQRGVPGVQRQRGQRTGAAAGARPHRPRPGGGGGHRVSRQYQRADRYQPVQVQWPRRTRQAGRTSRWCRCPMSIAALSRRPMPARDTPRHVADAMRHGRALAAFFCESALGCGGQVILPPGYLREVIRGRARGGRRVRRRRSADRLRPRGLALLDVRDAGRGAGYRHHGQADRQRPSDGRGGHDARDRALVRQRHGVLQYVRRQSGVVRRGAGGARRDPRRRLAGERARNRRVSAARPARVAARIR